MATMTEYLAYFQLSESFTLEQLKKAYYAQAQLLHPDRFSSPEEKKAASDEFQKLQDAYTNLQVLLEERRKSEEAFLAAKRNLQIAKEERVSRQTNRVLDCETSRTLMYNLFGMSVQALSLYLSLLNGMYEDDMADLYQPIWDFPEHYEGDTDEKKLWHISWQDHVRRACLHRDPKKRATFWVDRSPEYREAQKAVRVMPAPFLGRLLALEVAAFDLYWPLPEDRGHRFQLFTIEDEFLKRCYHQLFEPLGISAETVYRYRGSLESVFKTLYPEWKTLHHLVFPRGDGTIFGAALSAERPLTLMADTRSKCATVAPEAVAMVGAGMRLCQGDDPRCVVIGAGTALLMPVCGEGSMYNGNWSMAEVVMSLAKLEVFTREAILSEPAYRFCRDHLVQLLEGFSEHLATYATTVPDAEAEKLGLIRSWVHCLRADLAKD
ncbi:MAG TPA: J domain-containing protein [Candidatus Ozemobacteraceae bacterium]|nr:J domain-containing protein [Candidatus Ozemobacteraceae bacterium]